MQFKKSMAFVLAVTMVTAMASCNSRPANSSSAQSASSSKASLESASTSSSSSSGATKTGGKTLEYWVSWTPGADTEKQLVPKFKEWETKTGNKINYSVATYDMLHDKLVSAAAAGNTPDLAWGLPEWVGEFSKMGILADLTAKYDSWSDKSSLYDSVLKAMTVNGQKIGIPYEMTVRALLSHTTINQKAGASVPKVWSDVLKLTDYHSKTGKYPYGLAGTGVRSPQELLVYLAQEGLEICSESSGGKYKNTWKSNPDQLKKAAEVFQFYDDLVSKGVVDPNTKTWGWEKTDENFATGITGMYVSGNWLEERETTNPDTMKDVAISAIPYPSDGKPATYMEVKPEFIFQGCKNLDEAFDLAEFICSKEVQEAGFKDRSPRKDVSSDTKWSKDFQALANTGIVFPPVTLGGVTKAMTDAIAKVLQNGEKPADVAAWLSDQINASLKDSNEYAD